MQTLTKEPTLAPSIPAVKISKIRSARSGVIIEAKLKIGLRNTEFSHNFYDFKLEPQFHRQKSGVFKLRTPSTRPRDGERRTANGKLYKFHRVHRVHRARLFLFILHRKQVIIWEGRALSRPIFLVSACGFGSDSRTERRQSLHQLRRSSNSKNSSHGGHGGHGGKEWDLFLK